MTILGDILSQLVSLTYDQYNKAVSVVTTRILVCNTRMNVQVSNCTHALFLLLYASTLLHSNV